MSRVFEQPTPLAALVCALREAAAYNGQDEAAPIAVLWTDKERQWEPLIPMLSEELPLFALGEFKPECRTGPAYWLRCVVDRSIEHPSVQDGKVPIIYMPGVSRQELRSVESCPAELIPLIELQFRGTVWKQKNGHDWTVAAFLQNLDLGLGIQVATDSATKEALANALTTLAEEPLSSLRSESPLKAPYLNALLNPDEAKRILQWINDADGTRATLTAEEWEAFAAICRDRYTFDPEKDTVMTAAQLMGQRSGAWARVWSRFAESPESYGAIPSALRRARPAQLLPLVDYADSWPQDSEAAEAELRKALLALPSLPPDAARQRIHQLEAEHKHRRETVWKKIGTTPLATAILSLDAAATETDRGQSGATVSDLAQAYANGGWKADVAALQALAAIESAEDLAAVRAALATFYKPWLDQAARALQGAVAKDGGYVAASPPLTSAGTCILFSDGLRLDVAHLLADELARHELHCDVEAGLAALPTVTGTAKPSISPAATQFTSAPQGLDPLMKSGQPVTAPGLRKALQETGCQVLQGENLGDPTGQAWTEIGNLDAYGHQQGLTLARRVGEEVRMIRERIEALITHGWKEIVVVTDHGWLLVPGELPKAALPINATDVRKGRAARIKEGAKVEQQTVPWRWDSSVRIAIAPGIHCFEAGKEYEHGGISPQECVVPMLHVRARAAPTPQVELNSNWVGLRCQVAVHGGTAGMRVDLRSKPGDADSSLAGGGKELSGDGTASLPVADDDREGDAAWLVVLNRDGSVLVQGLTSVGGN